MEANRDRLHDSVVNENVMAFTGSCEWLTHGSLVILSKAYRAGGSRRVATIPRGTGLHLSTFETRGVPHSSVFEGCGF